MKRGRWALDLLEADENSPIYYTEDAHPPVLASFATVVASQDRGSITPAVLLDPDGEYIAKSDVLLRKFCPFLYPKEIEQEVKDLEEDLGERLGPTIRVYCYHYMLQPENQATLIEICAGGTTKVEQFLFAKMMSKGIEKGIRTAMGINEESVALSKKVIRQVFAEMSDRLEKNGGNFLLDKKNKSYGFTAADLTFAALASPLLRPKELANFSCSDEKLPSIIVEFADELKETTAGKHVVKMYAEHRLPDDEGPNVVTLKSVNRDRLPWPELMLVASIFIGAGAIIYQKAVSHAG